jgi:hypothetical protein
MTKVRLDELMNFACQPASGSEYVITGRRQAIEDAKLEFCVHLMDITSDDKHNMQLDPNYIPSPAVNKRLSSKFFIPVSMNIAYESVLLRR